jgi:bacteriocin biosynthesis cyclodehydratase domain-containing protein
MTAHSESALDARPTVKQDVIFARTGDGVIFHNASTGFQLAGATAYDFAKRVIPHLNGQTRVLEIRDALPERHRGTFLSLVESLTRYGFVRTEEPADHEVELAAEVLDQFGPQINYIAHYQGGARRRFRQVRQARVAVLGSDDTARWVVLGLLRNGFAHLRAEAPVLDVGPSDSAISDELATLDRAGIPATVDVIGASSSDWSDLGECQAVIVCGDEAATRTAALLSAGIPEGTRLLSAIRVGERVIVGPLMSMTVPGCVTCALLRLGATDASDRLADCLNLWTSLTSATLGAPELRGSRPVAAMLGNLLAYEVFREVSGLMPPESQGAVIVQHLDSADVSTEPLLAHPRCIRCAPLLPDSTGDLYAIVPESRPRVEANSEASEEPTEENRPNRFQSLFGANVGILARFEDAADEQLPVRVGRVVVGVRPGERRGIVAFDVHTTYAARTRSVCAATALYALASTDGVPVDDDPTVPRIDPGRFPLSSLRRPVGVQKWVRAITLLGRSDIAVPAAAVFSTGPHNADGIFHRSGAGVVAAPTLAQAVGGAVVSALGGEALLRRVSDNAVTEIDHASLIRDDQLAYLLSSARNLGAALQVLDLGSDCGVPVVLARAVTAGNQKLAWALGSALTWRQAATNAICDTIGQIQVRSSDACVDLGLPVLETFHPWSLIPGDIGPASLATGTSFERIRTELRSEGRDLALVDVGANDLAQAGIRVVRALVFSGDL